MTKPNKTIAEKLLALLERGHSITSAQAMDKWGTMRIAARVRDLRKEGHGIISIPVRLNGKNLVRYRMP